MAAPIPEVNIKANVLVLHHGNILNLSRPKDVNKFLVPLLDSWLETAELVSFRFRTGSGLSLVQDWLADLVHWLVSGSVSGQDWLVSVHWLVSGQDWLVSVHCFKTGLVTGQLSGSGYWTVQVLDCRLKETLSRATRSEHATNEINEGGGEVDSPFTSQIDPVLSESAHVSTPTTTPIGLSKLTPSETLLPDGRSFAEVQEVERYILAAREKEIESLRKAEQRRATLAKAPMTSTNPLQSPELTTLTSQPIGSHIASGSKDTPNASILDGVFLNENWEYNLQTEKLTDLYTSYTYHVGWLDVIQATSNSTSVDEQQWMICDVIHSIVQMERQNLGINMPSMGPMRFLDTTKAKQPTISQMETPSVSPMDPSYIVLPGVSMQSEPTHGSFSFLDLVQPSLGDLPTPTMNMTGGAPSTSLAGTTPLHTSVAPLPIPIGVHQPYVPVVTHPYVAPMPPPNPIAYVPQSHYPSPYFSGAVPVGINTSYPTSAIPEPISTSFRPSLGAVPYEVWDPRRVRMPRPKPANPFPYVVPRVPTFVASTPIMPTHLGDLAAFAQTIGRSIVENMHNLPDRELRSKAVQVAKIAQKYNGDGDVRKHVEIFEQVCDSLGEYNDLNRCRALNLTLSGKAGDWYRTLRVEEKTIYPTLRRLFLKEYIREGVLWGVASQLQKAKREDGESVRDFISRLKNLNSRCTPNERFNNNQLLDRFIRGLHHENIYNGLIIRGIPTWEAVTTNAIELEDNLMIAKERVSSDTESANPQASRHEPMTIKPIVKEPKIADMTLMDFTKAIQESLKVNQVPQNTHMYPRREQQWCSICFGPHSTSECPTFRAKFNGICHICGKYDHQAKDCLMLKRMMVTNRPSLPWTDSPRVPALMPAPPIEQPSQHLVHRTQNVVQSMPLPPPVLGLQPPHPRISPVNQVGCESSSAYVECEEEIDPGFVYGTDVLEECPMYYMEDPWGQIKPVYQATALAARGQNINMVARRPPLQCFIYGGPHRAAECPNRMPRDATPMQPSQVDMATSIASSSISIEERYPFSLSQLYRLCYLVISLEWDHIEQLARKKNLDELEWLIRLLTTSDPYPIEDMHPIAQIYPLAQVDYTRLVRFLVLLCEEDDEDIEDDWTDMSHGMTDNDFIYLDDEDRGLALGLPPNLYNILFP
ncbi:hypothetical protein L7F22_005811 [Adiantum nelumboides]|nr:hypothetical protein [Adiantum nelumboides]